MELTLYLALIAGLVSFISPCVLPLVPAYIGYMGGRMTHTIATTAGGSVSTAVSVNQRFVTLFHSLFFVAGFSFVFVSIGLLSTAFISIVGGSNISTLTNLIGRIGGVFIIFFGLHFMGVLPNWLNRLQANRALISSPLTGAIFAGVGGALILWGFSGHVFIWDSPLWELAPWAPILGLIALAVFGLWLFLGGAFTQPARFWQTTINQILNALYTDTRRDMQMAGAGGGYSSSALMGVVFSAGWTPCIGPVYGAVLTMAANGGDVGQAGSLLAAYSLGLGIPFMLTALALDGAQNILRRVQRHMRKIELVSGAFLVLIGLLVASGQLQSLSQQLSGQFAEFSIQLEESVLGAITGSSADETDAPAEGQSSAPAQDIIIAQDKPLSASAPDLPAQLATSSSGPVVTVSSITELAASGGPSVGISLGNLAPGFETVTDSGQPVQLADFRGQVVILNFWATWCGPCRVEMPAFETVYQAYKDQGLAVIAVNNAETAAAVRSFRDEMSLNFVMALDENASIQNRYNIFSYPSTFILDRDGTILARHFGPLTADQITALVEDVLVTS
jgi:cytochrome c-type biogenesis protein